MQYYSRVSEVDAPEVPKGQWYIYVLLNEPQNFIKIGRTRNPQQRFRALSGSNNGGNQIVKIGLSPVTYLYSLETVLHNHFHAYRVEGTEWFANVSFDDVCVYLDQLFQDKSYALCNHVRKEFMKTHQNMDLQECGDV